MKSRGSGDGAGAQALRQAGYFRCPRYWVTAEQYELICYMMEQNRKEVERIKRDAEALEVYPRYDSRRL